MGIKINKELDFFSNYDPTKESKPVALKTLCDDIESKKLTLPIFQTYIRWTLEKSVSLLNFQLNGKAAVSPISINVIENQDIAVPQVTFIDRELIAKEDVKGKHSVNDGQQRLSCNYKAYTDHDDFKCIVLDISKGIFIINMEKLKKNQIPVGILYNKDPKTLENYIKKRKDLQQYDVYSLLTRIRSKFLGYYYTVNYARDLDEEEQLEWFDVLNLAGSRITAVQMQLTEMLTKGVDFYKEYSDLFIDKLENSKLDDLIIQKATEISIPLAALNPAYQILKPSNSKDGYYCPIASDSKGTYISKLESSEIREMFRVTLEALDKAIDFIESNNLDKPNRIDYLVYLTGYFVLNADADYEFLTDWFNQQLIVTNSSNPERRKIFNDLVDNRPLSYA